ncbi:MAG: zinc metallopeptidase, partial [Clostridia bacterium]
MYLDWYYVALVLPAVIFSMICSFMVNSTFKKYSKVISASGITGADAAKKILQSNGIYDVAIERVNGKLTDHFDPKAKVIRLSDSVYSSQSTAAIGVAAHEAGHAVQYAVQYAPMKLRSAVVPFTNFSSNIGMLLIVVGISLCYMGLKMQAIAYAGVILFSACALFQLITLPTEFNASRRALKALESTGIMSGTELNQSKKVLSAAAMTYIAALAVSIMTILRFVMIIK